MSNYKLKNWTAKKQDEYWYRVSDEITGFNIPAMYIENEDFGWEKAEEPFMTGNWIFGSHDESEYLMRFEKKNGQWITTREFYHIYKGRVESCKNVFYDVIDNGSTTKAAPEQVERILSIVARHKGYKEGVLVVSAYNGKNYRLDAGNPSYEPDEGLFWYLGYCIYSKGTWAKIVEEPKASEPLERSKPFGFVDAEDFGHKAAEPEAGLEYECIESLMINLDEIAFKKGKKYVFKNDGVYLKAIDEKGNGHFWTPENIKAHFAMETDWRTAKVFSYEDIEEDSNDLSKSITRSLKIAGEEFLLIPCKWLEEEAKKRTNA